MANNVRVKIGEVPVDSGQVFIVDPCYVLRGEVEFDDNGNVTNNTAYSRACAASMGEAQAGPFRAGVDVNIRGEAITVPDAVCTSTGYGDGMYPVYVEYEDCGSWGRRIKSITVEFISDDEYDEWDEDEDEDYDEDED